MLVTSLLKTALEPAIPTSHFHHECGACGATRNGPNDDCPYCEASRIVTFELEP